MIRKKYKKLDYNTEDLEGLSNSDLKKIADYELRQYLLKNSQNVGNFYWCPLKQKSFHKDSMHACHYIDRQCMTLRYNLKNVHLISAVSNTFDAQVQKEGYKSLHHYDYEQYLGEQIVKDLREKSKEIKIFYKDDYIEIINKFRNNE